jgi:aspartyl/asparaginyl beta-hydroxylase (cupin superfamily)
MPFVKSKQEAALVELAQQASTSAIGRAVAEATALVEPISGSGAVPIDEFWQLMPSLIASKFPKVRDDSLQRVAGFVRHAILQSLPLVARPRPDDWNVTLYDNPFDAAKYRPYTELHTYMPQLGPTRAFHDASSLEFCRQLEREYTTICAEYQALLEYMNSRSNSSNSAAVRFQSVTSMNYDSGWQTLVLFYNGHRIPNFPYHLCPVTTRLLERIPLAGRIAGFNRQAPGTGIPRHTDGNNLWLTCQMGIRLPSLGPMAPPGTTQDYACITVADQTEYWSAGTCLVYDTTYPHETFNRHATDERVVLHVDFFNTLVLTATEIDVLQYIYSLREQFMKAEGVAKVGAHIL